MKDTRFQLPNRVVPGENRATAHEVASAVARRLAELARDAVWRAQRDSLVTL
jgi:hypothetical protein